MTIQWKKVLIGSGIAAILLLAANVLVAIWQTGTQAGQTYRWVCKESNLELIYAPGVFGNARLVPGNGADVHDCRWELVEPSPRLALLPWNWLVCVIDQPAPDPQVVIRDAKLRSK
jgi:hypothetical protein